MLFILILLIFAGNLTGMDQFNQEMLRSAFSQATMRSSQVNSSVFQSSLPSNNLGITVDRPASSQAYMQMSNPSSSNVTMQQPSSNMHFNISTHLSNAHQSKHLDLSMQKQLDQHLYHQLIKDQYWSRQIESKLEIVDSQIAQVRSVFQESQNHCIKPFQLEKQFSASNLSISASTELNRAFKPIKQEMQKILFDSKGEFRGITCNTDAEKMQKLMNDFDKIVDDWHKDPSSIVKDLNQSQPYEMVSEFEQQIRSNQFNRDIAKVINYCKKKDTDVNKAAEIVLHYQEASKNKEGWFVSGREFNHYSKIRNIYDNRFSARYDIYGIDHKYKNDPLYEQFKKTPINEGGISRVNINSNEALGYRYEAHKQVLNNLGIHNISPRLQHNTYKIVDLLSKHEPLVIAEKLAHEIYLDQTNKNKSDTYNLFYENGLPKIFSYNEEIKNIQIPSTIGNQIHAQERISLFKLARMKIDDPCSRQVVNRGIDYIIKACGEGDNWQDFSKMAKACADGTYQLNTNEALICANLAIQPHNKELVQIQPKLIRCAASVANLLQNKNLLQSEKIAMQTTVHNLDTLWNEAIRYNNLEAKNHLIKITPKLDKLLQALPKNNTQKETSKEEITSSNNELIEKENNNDFALFPDEPKNTLRDIVKSNPELNNLYKYSEGYLVSADSKYLLTECGIKNTEFDQFYGNSVQHKLHQEFINIIDKAGWLYKKHYQKPEVKNLSQHIVQFADVGREYNRAGAIAKAITIADCCWGLLDCGIGIAEGAAQGIGNTANTILHPIETIKNMTDLITAAGKGLGKVINFVFEAGTDLDKYQTLQPKALALYNALQERLKQATVRDVAREVTSFGVEMYLTGKLTKVTHNFLRDAKGRAKKAIKAIENHAPQRIPVTPEGIQLPIQTQIAEEAGKNLFDLMEKAKDKIKGTAQILKIRNMYEFFETDFGKLLKGKVEKIKGTQMYRIIEKINHPDLKKGDIFYLDKLHLDHIEVFDHKNRAKTVLNLNGTPNKKINLNRRISF
ncbi:MAG: hypothetical protein WDZ41_04080 [Candidatus Babeliales bacterium]